ncbi:hypothetical protein HDU78_009669 [Chytriomyces hyalinus]|nr:hypothetical protein HDU78_009669 [Chytriomyces hyalinus]
MPKKSAQQAIIEQINQCILFEALDDDDAVLDGWNSESGSDLAEESSMDELLDLMHLVQSSQMIEDCQSIPKTPALRNHVLQMADKEFRVRAQMNQQSFCTLVSKIEAHPIFTNNSRNKQIAVNVQLLLALEQLGCSGNGAGVARTSNHVGVSWGSAVLYRGNTITGIRVHKVAM